MSNYILIYNTSLKQFTDDKYLKTTIDLGLDPKTLKKIISKEINAININDLLYQFKVEEYNDLSFISILITNPSNEKLLSIGEMTSGIIHDINNPLSIIMSSFEILQSEIIDQEIDIDNKYLNNIEMAVTNISDIVDGVLSFCRKDQQMNRKFNFLDLIKKINSYTNTFLIKNNISFNIESSSILNKNELNYIGRDTLISQVIFNLIKNANDAIKDLPNFSKWIKLNIYKNDKNIVIEIIDGGKGIPDEIKDEIFNNFFTTKTEGNGTGIGLFFCQKIMHEHGGSISLQKNAKNTTFILNFPLKKSI